MMKERCDFISCTSCLGGTQLTCHIQYVLDIIVKLTMVTEYSKVAAETQKTWARKVSKGRKKEINRRGESEHKSRRTGFKHAHEKSTRKTWSVDIVGREKTTGWSASTHLL